MKRGPTVCHWRFPQLATMKTKTFPSATPASCFKLRPVAATMPIEVMEEFAREGWIRLGWQIGRDSMHFQPAR